MVNRTCNKMEKLGDLRALVNNIAINPFPLSCVTGSAGDWPTGIAKKGLIRQKRFWY